MSVHIKVSLYSKYNITTVPNQSFCKHCETHRKCSTRPACKAANYQSKNENLIHDDGIKEEINKSVKEIKKIQLF